MVERKITQRRFGPGFERPCRHPTVVVCTYWECQIVNRCQGLRGPEKPLPEQLRALKEGAAET